MDQVAAHAPVSAREGRLLADGARTGPTLLHAVAPKFRASFQALIAILKRI
jgi:hypothetical protein